MRKLHVLVGLLCFTGVNAAFTPRKREHAFKRQQDVSNPSLKQQQDAIIAAAATYCSEEACYPPPFAIAQAAVAMTPIHHEVEPDDDLVIGYGTGVIACVVSLALGFSLGYVTI